MYRTATGCASPGSSRSAEEVVTERAQQRQNLIHEPNYEAVYEYLSPGYRSITPYRAYLATLGTSVKRVGAIVKSVKCEAEEICMVNMEVSYFYAPKGMQGKPGDIPITRISEEKWIKVDGQWWLYKDLK